MSSNRRGSYTFQVKQIGASFHVVGEPDGFTQDAGWKPLVSRPFKTRAEAEESVESAANALLRALENVFGDVNGKLTHGGFNV
jgi:hypothetical protein